jgi:hypothetical protein
LMELSLSATTTEVDKALSNLKIDDIENVFCESSYLNLPSNRGTAYFIHVVPSILEEDTKLATSTGDVSIDLLLRRYCQYRCKFATEVMELLLVDRFVCDQNFSIEAFKRAVTDIPELKSWYGYALEANGHGLTLRFEREFRPEEC